MSDFHIDNVEEIEDFVGVDPEEWPEIPTGDLPWFEGLPERFTVLMENEGTYPYVGGGVSTWCHILCENITEVDWYLFAVVAEPCVDDRYKTFEMPHIKERYLIPLWGAEETAEYIDKRHFKDVHVSKLATTAEVIDTEFIPYFVSFLRGLEEPDLDMSEYGWAIYQMYHYFQRYDYNITFKSQQVWDAFRDFYLDVFAKSELFALDPPCLFSVTTALRWLYNMFMPIAAEVPDTTITHATIAASTAIAGVVSKFEYGTPFLLTDHGVYARERYIACSTAPFDFYGRRFLARLGIFYSKICYYYSDIVAPCAHFNARWELPMGCVLDRHDPIDFEGWENTGIVPNLTEVPFLRPTYDALVDYDLMPPYEEDKTFPWIRTIYNGVDCDRFKPGEKPEHLRGMKTCVALARVFPLKDVLTMIESCAVAKRSIPDVKYIVYGSLKADPPYVQKCHDLIAELGLEDNFDLAGYHSKPNEAFWEGDISVLSSISEGFPFTVLESMACGVPVVATDVGGCKEALGLGADATGLVVKPRDPEAFGAAVVEMLTNEPMRLEFARKARERIVRLFQTSTSVDAYRETYFRLANVKKRRVENLSEFRKTMIPNNVIKQEDVEKWIHSAASREQLG